jgi:hypothetical protein
MGCLVWIMSWQERADDEVLRFAMIEFHADWGPVCGFRGSVFLTIGLSDWSNSFEKMRVAMKGDYTTRSETRVELV